MPLLGAHAAISWFWLVLMVRSTQPSTMTTAVRSCFAWRTSTWHRLPISECTRPTYRRRRREHCTIRHRRRQGGKTSSRPHYTVRSSPFLRSVDGGTELLSVGFVLYAPLLLCPSFLAVCADIRLIPGDLAFNHFSHVPLKRLLAFGQVF
jgi:hypothetical protein